ncbi:MAG: hypothetical protein LUC24_04070 [Bacteroidales bacterium]|nr:hypothetical protein [Bacteroidales bacterium]
MASALFLTACTDEEYTVATGEVVTGVTTGSATTTAVSAVLTGTVSGLQDLSTASYTAGAYYGTSEDPASTGSRQSGSVDEDGNITVTVTGLTTGTTYYYTIYVTLQGKVTYYGDVKTFVATDVNVTTASAADVSACKATLNCSVSGTDGLEDVPYGIKLALSESGVADGNEYECGTLSGLLPNHTYYYAGYANLDGLYVYGETKSFTTATQEIEYVDLGLKTLWATMNVGAESETEAGALVGYGDPTGLEQSTSLSAYGTGDIAGTENDIAYALGISEDGDYLPTASQIAELISGTTQSWETVDGVDGIRFTASNGNSIFLPAAGYREGAETAGEGGGYYWSGSVYTADGDYANTLRFDEDGVESGLSSRYVGLSVRCVQPAPKAETGNETDVEIDNSKLAVGDLEGNGNIRLELYNIYGSTASTGGAVNVTDIAFSKNMVINFTITGLDGNFADGAASEFYAGIEYTNVDWWPGYWYDTSLGYPTQYEAVVTGDGTYTVYWEADGTCTEAMVYCIDIVGLGNALVDKSQVSATINSILLDRDLDQSVNNDIVEFNNKDGDGTNGRIEIYNEYGNTGSSNNGYYNSSLAFNGQMVVTFTISGIDGNLVDGADGSYDAELSYADADWWPSYWGEASYGNATVTGDGTYTVYAYLNGDCEGAVVWTIELYDLWQDLSDTSKVTATIDRVVTPWKN